MLPAAARRKRRAATATAAAAAKRFRSHVLPAASSRVYSAQTHDVHAAAACPAMPLHLIAAEDRDDDLLFSDMGSVGRGEGEGEGGGVGVGGGVIGDCQAAEDLKTTAPTPPPAPPPTTAGRPAQSMHLAQSPSPPTPGPAPAPAVNAEAVKACELAAPPIATPDASPDRVADSEASPPPPCESAEGSPGTALGPAPFSAPIPTPTSAPVPTPNPTSAPPPASTEPASETAATTAVGAVGADGATSSSSTTTSSPTGPYPSTVAAQPTPRPHIKANDDLVTPAPASADDSQSETEGEWSQATPNDTFEYFLDTPSSAPNGSQGVAGHLRQLCGPNVRTAADMLPTFAAPVATAAAAALCEHKDAHQSDGITGASLPPAAAAAATRAATAGTAAANVGTVALPRADPSSPSSRNGARTGWQSGSHPSAKRSKHTVIAAEVDDMMAASSQGTFARVTQPHRSDFI